MLQDLAFSHFVLRPHARQLVRSGKAVPLGARAFDVLNMLAQRAGDLVTKAELLAQIWPGLVVEENNLQVHISTLRKLVGADHIVTIPGRGYRFTAPVSLGDPQLAPVGAAKQAQRSAQQVTSLVNTAALATSASRSIAVLPFANLGGDTAQEYFSDGLAEDIISKLSRSPWLYVKLVNDNGRRIITRAVRLVTGWRTRTMWCGLYALDTSTYHERQQFIDHTAKRIAKRLADE